MTGSVESDSTANVVAPAGEARRDRNVERFPGQQRTPTWPARPQAAPELQHSNRESEIHFRMPLMFRPRWPGTIALDESAGVITCHTGHVIVLNRRVSHDNFENTWRWQILQWLASE